MEPKPPIYTVSQVSGLIHDLLENSFPEIWVEGEISNCRSYPSGHTYMTLKDEASQIKAVLFKGSAWNVRFTPEDGLKVLVRARISSYAARGDLQLVISTMEPREKGALQLALEQLKAKLTAEGLFDEARKQPLPRFPRRIGIVTSSQGAAVHDMITVLSRRWPAIEILLYPVRVQGEGAKEDIARAIADFNQYCPDTDVLLVGRGGGSIEDLWAFNEELVVRVIAASKIPIISCVGHETDMTLADCVADRRAPTPSAAAELAVPDRAAVLAQIVNAAATLASAMDERIGLLTQRLNHAQAHPLLQSPHRLYEERIRRIDELYGRICDSGRRFIVGCEASLRLQAEKLDAFSPLKVLGRGYSIVQKASDGAVVRRARDAHPGECVRVRLSEGVLICEVKDGENN